MLPSAQLVQSFKRSRLLFADDTTEFDLNREIVEECQQATRIKLQAKIQEEYAHCMILPPSLRQANHQVGQVDDDTSSHDETSAISTHLQAMISASSIPVVEKYHAPLRDSVPNTVAIHRLAGDMQSTTAANVLPQTTGKPNTAESSLKLYQESISKKVSVVDPSTLSALVKSQIQTKAKPQHHAPWKLKTVISGHLGWVRSVAVDNSNEWFATGSADRLIKIWDLASGTLKLSLTGHIGAVRGLAISPRHPYLFSAGEDKQVKCWDLECNKVVRHYHGHLSAVYSLALHPTLDVLISGGRDSVARVWDMRTRNCVHILTGHSDTVSSVTTQDADPQVITGSHDSTVRLWDLSSGKSITTLTHHKKSIRALVNHPRDFTFASASPDAIKQFKLPGGDFIQNLPGHKAIINTLSTNEDEVLFSGGDDGTMKFWDWKSGYCYQSTATTVQPGSLDTEAGIFCSTFDKSGTRLITGEADKSIKIWWQDPNDLTNPTG